MALPSLYRDGLERQLDFELDYLMNRLITRISAEANGELILAEPMTERDYESAYSGYYWQITSEGKIVLASRSLAGWALELKQTAASAAFKNVGTTGEVHIVNPPKSAPTAYPISHLHLRDPPADDAERGLAASSSSSGR